MRESRQRAWEPSDGTFITRNDPCTFPPKLSHQGRAAAPLARVPQHLSLGAERDDEPQESVVRLGVAHVARGRVGPAAAVRERPRARERAALEVDDDEQRAREAIDEEVLDDAKRTTSRAMLL